MNKWIIFALIASGFVIVAATVIILIWGIQVIIEFLSTIFWLTIGLGVVILIAWLGYFLLIKKHKFDVTAVNKRKLVVAGKLQCPKQIKQRSLRLSGDKGHSYFIFGKIIGFLQIQVMLKHRRFDKEGEPEMKEVDGEMVPIFSYSISDQDVFICSTAKNFLTRLFEDYKVVRVDPRDHDDLIGDVTLFGLNLVPQSEYYYLNTEYLNVQKIDQAILQEGERGLMFELMKDWKSSIDQAINLDARHRKGIEDKQLVEIPQLQQVGIQDKQR